MYTCFNVLFKSYFLFQGSNSNLTNMVVNNPGSTVLPVQILPQGLVQLPPGARVVYSCAPASNPATPIINAVGSLKTLRVPAPTILGRANCRLPNGTPLLFPVSAGGPVPRIPPGITRFTCPKGQRVVFLPNSRLPSSSQSHQQLNPTTTSSYSLNHQRQPSPKSLPTHSPSTTPPLQRQPSPALTSGLQRQPLPSRPPPPLQQHKPYPPQSTSLPTSTFQLPTRVSVPLTAPPKAPPPPYSLFQPANSTNTSFTIPSTTKSQLVVGPLRASSSSLSPNGPYPISLVAKSSVRILPGTCG